MTAGSDVEIRQATVEDTEALVSLLVGGSLTVTEQPEDLEPYRRAMTEIATTAGTDVLVAVVAGAIVGMCQLITFRHLQASGGLCAEIESMHVAADRRSAGIGSVLLDTAVRRAAEAGCYRIQLTSNTARVEAQRFYRRHGFTPSHTGYKRYL